VLLASGYAVASERLEGLDIVMLAKPYSREALGQAIARLVPAVRTRAA